MATRRKTSTTKSQEQADRELHARLKSWFEMEHQRQELNRYQMALDCDYHDGIQWLADEAAEVRDRGQFPVVFNEIKPTIDWLIGTERRTRTDFKVLARRSKSKEAEADATLKTQLLKYLEDVNRTPFERSHAFDDAIKAGLGWLEVGITNDPEDEPIFQRHENWRNILHDSLGTRADLSDARYLFRFKEVDLDVAEAWFPGKVDELRRAETMEDVGHVWDDDWSGAWPTSRVVTDSRMPMRYISYNAESHLFNPRKRVSLVECWYVAPTVETADRATGHAHDRTRMAMRVAIMTKNDLLLDAPSPYAHNKFPFVPLWCYRFKKDGMPYGVVRNIRGPQDDLNKRMSKAQFLISVNQLRAEKSAFDKEVMDVEEVRDELARPNGVALFADGALSGNRVQVREGGNLAAGHLEVASRDSAAIRSVSGVTLENRGESSGGSSGKAILAKQDQGQMVTAQIFDNQLFARQIEGELVLSLIEQFYTEPKVFAVTGERYKLDYFEINGVDEATGLPVNDVTAHKASFVIGEAPWRQALAEAAFDSAMQMLGQLAPVAPQVVTAIIDLVFEWSDLPNKQAILQRIRQVTGMSDPDEGESPEQQAQKAQQQAVAKAQFEAQMAQMQAAIREAQAKGEKLEADAMARRLESLYMAAQGAQVLALNPGVSPIADELLRSAGFQDANSRGPGVLQQQPPQTGAAPAMPVAQQPIQEPMQADGALAGGMAGSITPGADGVVQPQQQQEGA